MRRFSSYGPVDKELHYYVPRQELIEGAFQQLLGDDPNKGGHYITVWAPRQTGKTWIMQQVLFILQQDTRFDVVYLPLQDIYLISDINQMAQILAQRLIEKLGLENLTINTLGDLHLLFKRETLRKPLILILDEFDGLDEAVIAGLVSLFRNIYHIRQSQADKATAEKDYLLHSMAFIGVRTVLGIENVKGSPFNIQRSVHIPNLTHDEVVHLFNCYQQESGQLIEPEVVKRIWSEFQGQPGLTGWIGELLTETYNQAPEQPITMAYFKEVYAEALNLPNNNILNIISKAKQLPYKAFVLELFQTKNKTEFIYEDPIINFLYMNGVVDVEYVKLGEKYLKFPCPFIQKRLFNYFARNLYHEMDGLYGPFEDLSDTITDNNLNVRQLLMRYERYLQANRNKVLKNAPRRQDDLRVYEAVFHFHLYLYLVSFLRNDEAQVHPEFPTGNGQIDLLIHYAGQLFGLELKSFADKRQYQNALTQAVKYGKRLKVSEIWLVLFIEAVDDTNRQRFELDYTSKGITVHPQFVQTGSVCGS
ncbi:AAA-like domain-containing protein [Candidatus Marithioploca araucensis]|uniref:AAA-like domain-containing protein n=1 Tax=Candidatus Marithioploca araucensis TaxID=70273 RepID=A0ABT7VSR3_9GAMM|nr:AAA-like domain-containing protein [Candidatus Marithioploca araucensis]